jgi:Flp pilus assembly protein TadG
LWDNGDVIDLDSSSAPSPARERNTRERPRRNRQRGGAAVEFALVFPILCAVMFGMIDYGWYFYERFSVASAVRDGLRLAVVMSQTATNPDPSTAAINRAMADLTAAGMNPPNNTFTASTSGAYPQKLMTLSANFAFTPLVHFVPLPTNSIKYQMTMMFEQQ